MAKTLKKLPNLYDFPIFRALVEVEMRRIRAGGVKRETNFSIGFLYSPSISDYISGSPKYLGFMRKVKEILREPDVITPVEEDFLFFFFPDISRKEAEEKLNNLKKLFRGREIIDGIASYPEDGQTEYDLFNRLVQIMNEKLIPVIELYSED